MWEVHKPHNSPPPCDCADQTLHFITSRHLPSSHRPACKLSSLLEGLVRKEALSSSTFHPPKNAKSLPSPAVEHLMRLERSLVCRMSSLSRVPPLAVMIPVFLQGCSAIRLRPHQHGRVCLRRASANLLGHATLRAVSKSRREISHLKRTRLQGREVGL